MPTSLPSIKLVLAGATEPVDIQINDTSGAPVDAAALSLVIMDMSGFTRWSDDIINPTTNIVKASATTGYYYYNFGVIPEQAASIGDYLIQWTVRVPGLPPYTTVQNIKVITPLLMSNLPYLRLLIDKSRKFVDPSNDVFLGYTDAQLVMFMEGGIQIINAYQPGNIGFDLLNFPYRDFRHILLESALISGVMSQELFAVDTDLPQYSDQGTNFIISHQPQLAAFLNQVTQRLDKAIPMMKLQFVTTGSIRVEAGPNFRLAMLLQSAPHGALFRNLFFRG